MNLYLIRHAIAEPRRDDLEDARRALTDEGRRRFAAVAAGLERLGVRFDRLYHSPLLRAMQTAELLAPIVEGESEVTPLLAEPPRAALLDAIAGERVALVGHEPWMSALLGQLIAVEMTAAEPFDFKKGGVAWLSGEARPGGMILKALLPPRVFR